MSIDDRRGAGRLRQEKPGRIIRLPTFKRRLHTLLVGMASHEITEGTNHSERGICAQVEFVASTGMD